MPRRTFTVASLLFFSGFCALIYQVAWLRELRLVFGASTPASAAVTAVFMGGLGAGGLWLGKRADRLARPLALYANLELGIAATTALTPLLLIAVRHGYVALGGSTTLGPVLGTVVRLLLSALVLLPPTLLMGGTLPAAARAAVDESDRARRTTALLYGSNTLGAVVGATAATFWLLEIFGTRSTLWMGCLVNGLVAVTARVIARSLPTTELATAAPTAAEPAAGSRSAPAPFVLTAAAVVGFVFMAMELVWYRMLSPLLGGSTYTFGLILATALLGIGVGGALYTLRGQDRPVHLGALAASCLLEAACLAVPYALGDSVAMLALVLRPLRLVGFAGLAAGWTVVAAVVVLPASIVAGYQFPLLIALLGRAGTSLGRQVGLAYAFNTLGSILGSLAGGFWLLPKLGALGAWRYGVLLLVVLGLCAAAERVRRVGGWLGRMRTGAAALAGALCACWLVVGPVGPTAVWRHSPIGAGRSEDLVTERSANARRNVIDERKRAVSWEADGRESSIALYTLNDTSFLVNGKSDGAAVLDAGTQVMGGLLGALLHPGSVRRALVVGLGSGSTAGWLARLPDVERVDVVELEPAMLEVARRCSPVNEAVLDNPKVHVIIGDAREVLLTTAARYDLVFSEPSNPYRAGVASLFTREFYDAVRARLREDGVFVQWLQAYEVDPFTIRTVYATLGSAFPVVESWRTKDTDLVLVSSDEERPLHLPTIRQRIAAEPFQRALMAAWRVHSVEGLIAHYVARASFARAVAAQAGPELVSVDDRNQLEFSFPRALDGAQEFRIADLRNSAVRRFEQWPVLAGMGEPGGEPVDWELVHDELISFHMLEGETPERPTEFTLSTWQERRYEAQRAWRHDEPDKVVSAWEAQPREPRTAMELITVADAYAVKGDGERAEPLIARLAPWVPVEASAVMARLRFAQDRHPECQDALVAAVQRFRTDPWASNDLMARTLPIAVELARRNRTLVVPMWELLEPKLNVDALTYLTRALRLDLGLLGSDPTLCVRAIDDQGPHIPWYLGFLQQRAECYRKAQHPRLAEAQEDLRGYLAAERVVFGADLPAVPRPAGEPATEPSTAATAALAPSEAPTQAVGAAAPSASASAAAGPK